MTLEQMQQQLQEQHTAMSRLQTHAHLQQVKANLLTTSLRAKLRRREQELKLLQSEHEQRISAVISHLLYLEGHMLKEHKEIIEILHNKDDIIRRQKTTIEDLTAKNDRYLEALKDGHIYPADNGLVTNLAHVTNLDTDVSTQDHDSMVILSENKNKQGEKVQGSGHKVRFSTMKDRLRRHKSSLELYQHEPLETLMESIPKYGSEENLAIVDNADKSKIINRKEKCRSLNDYPVVHRDLDDGLTESPDGYFTDFNIPTISRHDSTSSLVIFDEKTARRNDGLSSAAAYGFNELSKSRSVPHALPTVSENDSGSPNFKGRQKSLPSVEMLAKDMPTASTAAAISASSSMINIYPSRSPTNSSPPSESNPFKTFKNVFKRKGSKKKRPATLPSGKEQKQTLKQHFEKFDLR